MDWDGKTERRLGLCQQHSDRLHNIEKILTGNGGSIDDRRNSMFSRQELILKFIIMIQKIFWIIVPVCVAGALAAIWQMLRTLVIQGTI